MKNSTEKDVEKIGKLINDIQVAIDEYNEEQKHFEEEQKLLEERRALKREEKKKEKLELLKIIKRLEEDLESDEFENLDELYEPYINNEEISKRDIKPNTTRCSLIFMFYVISPAFSIINLIGIYESITILKIIFKLLKNSVIYYFKYLRNDKDQLIIFSIQDFNDNYNFYNLFYEDTKKETFDFNLMMLSGFLGDIILKSKGFRVSTIIFFIMNSISIFLIRSFGFLEYNEDYSTYSFFQILYLFLCWILLFIGVGASTLLSQQIIVDSNSKYNKYLIILNEKSEKKWEQKKEKWESMKKEIERKTKYFSDNSDDLISTNEIINDSELGKSKKNYGQNKSKIKEEDEEKNLIDINDNKNNNKEFEIEKISIDKDDENIPVKKENFNRKKEERIKKKEKNSKNKSDSFFMICLTTIISYFLKYFLNIIISVENENRIEEYMNMTKCKNESCYEKLIKNVNLSITDSVLYENLKKKIYEDDQYSFYFIIIIYSGSIILSIILYSIFVCIFSKSEKDKNKEGDNYQVCEICGYTIYSEDIILKYNPPCCENLWLFCKTIQNCLGLVMCSCYQCCCNICGADDVNYFSNTDHGGCCGEYKNENYDKNKEFFCYCYQVKRKQKWFNKFITSDIQVKILPYMIEYFFIQIMTIAFEKQYLNFDAQSEVNHVNKSKLITIDNFYTFITFILTFFLFFYCSLSFNTFLELYGARVGLERKKFSGIKRLSNGMLDGIHGIALFNGLFTLIFSSLYLSNNELELFKNKNFCLIPVLMNKFYYFSLIFFCVSYSEKIKTIELIPGSTLISIYLFIWDIIISLIRDNASFKGLYITQIVFSCLFPCIIIIFLIALGTIICCCESDKDCKDRLSYFFCICSFFLCFGGFWYSPEVSDNVNECVKTCECNYICDCFKDSCYCCYDCLEFFNCYDVCACSCCYCCECYDCLGCCSCIYCCGKKCVCYYC